MNSLGLHQYDVLHVISDLHMGGGSGFQIMNRGERLARFIEKIAEESPEARVGLVINGDAIDTLAEDFDGYIAVHDVDRVIGRIVRDSAFAPVWQSLARFVRQPGRRLVFTLGNHDIELALPLVQRFLRAELATGDDAADGRIEFATRGEGYTCLVGESRVFCTHGNEVDAWNLVDHEALRKVAVEQNAGIRFARDKWIPNAGTRLVRDVMNSVKRRYPWIDLLKPENNAAIGVLLVMDPGQLQAIRRAMPVVFDRVRGELKVRGLLSSDLHPPDLTASVGQPAEVPVRQLLGPNLLAEVERSGSAAVSGSFAAPDAQALLLDIEREMEMGTLGPATQAQLEGTLGWGQMLVDRVTGTNRVDALRRALLDWLRDDHTFSLTDRDYTCTEVLRQVGPDVDFVLTGHTHLERAITDGPRVYYNTGTWIRLMRLNEFVLQDQEAFDGLYRVLEKGTLADFDRCEVPIQGGTEPLIRDYTTVARIETNPRRTVGALYHVVDAPGGVRLEMVDDSLFARS